MSSIEKSLSSKVRQDGKSEILIRVSAGRGVRFRLRSNVFVSTEFWCDETQSVIVPPKRKVNASKVMEAQQQKASIEAYSRDLVAICNSAQEADVELTREWCEDCFSLAPFLQEPTNRFMTDATQSLYTLANIRRAQAMRQDAIDRAAKQEQEKAAAESAMNAKRLYDYIPVMCQRKQLSAVRTKNYRVLLAQLQRYEMWLQLTKDKNFQLDAETTTTEIVEDFRIYLRDEAKLQKKHPKTFARILAKCPIAVRNTQRKTPLPDGAKPKTRAIEERGENTIVGQMQKFKSLCNWLYEVGYMISKPFERVSIGKELYGTPIFITIEERKKIQALDLSNASRTLQVSRDEFVLQCLTGCRISDLEALTDANVKDDILIYRPHKTQGETGATATVPLCPEAKAIIEKYRDCPERGNRLIPCIAQQNLNYAIKSIFHMAGVTRQVERINPRTGEKESVSIADIASSHMARRTFVGGCYAQTQDPTIVGLMSGHVEGSKAFSRYVNRDVSMLKGIIDKIS